MRTIWSVAMVSTALALQPALAPQSWSATAPGTDWPGWLGANRDNKSADTGLLERWPQGGPKRLWRATGIGEGFSSVAVADGIVYATGAVDEKLILYAFDSRGEQRWKTTVDSEWTQNYPGTRATPTVDEGRVFLLTGTGIIACLEARSGRKVWSREMREFGGSPGGWGYAESPLLARKLCIVSPGNKTGMVGLDKTTGQTLWTSRGNGGPAHYSSAILAWFQNVPLVIQGNGSGLFAVHPHAGQVLWTNEFSAGNTANCPTPAYSDGYVFWANGYGKGGICLELQASDNNVKAVEAWRTNEMDCHHGGYVIHEGHIYGNHDGGWACLELRSGRRTWFNRGVGKGSLTYADGMLYLFSEERGQAALVRASPDEFETRGQFSVEGSGPSWAHPVVAGGRLYLRYAGNLYCFDVRGKP